MAENPKKDNDKFQWKQMSRTLLFWLFLFIAIITIVNIYNSQTPNQVKVKFTKYKQLLNEGAIKEATITGNIFNGKAGLWGKRLF